MINNKSDAKILGKLFSLIFVFNFLCSQAHAGLVKPQSMGSKTTGSSPITSLPKPKLDGFLDTTYILNLNGPPSRQTHTHSFDRKNDALLINALQLNVDGAAEVGLGYHGEIAFGTDPSFYKARGTNNPTEAGLPTAPSNVAYNFEVQEVYLTHKWSQQPIGLIFGKFEKLTGIERIESWKNANITRGIIFGNALPFTHIGVFADYQVNPIINFGLGLFNGWNMNTDNNSGKTFATKIGIGLSETNYGALTLYAGPEKNGNSGDTRMTLDTTWFLKPREETTVQLELLYGQERNSSIADANSDGVADGGDAKWYALSIQPVQWLSDQWSIGARYEWFYDKDGARLVTPYFAAVNGVTVQAITLTPTYKINEWLLVRGEFGYEWASRNGYVSDTGAVDKSSLPQLGAELIFKF